VVERGAHESEAEEMVRMGARRCGWSVREPVAGMECAGVSVRKRVHDS